MNGVAILFTYSAFLFQLAIRGTILFVYVHLVLPLSLFLSLVI